jgi:hypothetical protein
VSDYYLTIYSARGYREIGIFHYEGSFELTPQYQKDIDALKPVSKLHLILLVVYSFVIYGLWWLFSILPYVGNIYTLYLGMFLLIEVAVHFRHFRSVFIIREIKKNGGVDGEITYRKWFTYKLSAHDLYSFAGLYLLVAAVTFSPFFLGGAIMCAGTGLKHSRMARKAKRVVTS